MSKKPDRPHALKWQRRRSDRVEPPMTIALNKYTLAAYLTYDDGADGRYELIDGELMAMGQPTGEHKDVAEILCLSFKAEIDRTHQPWVTKQGEIAVSSPRAGRWDTCRIPDVIVLHADQWQAMRKREAIVRLTDPPPILVVEVVSESTKTADYKTKRSEYSVLNIPEYWVVDPLEQRITVFILEAGFYEPTVFQGSDRIVSPTFPGLRMTVEQVFGVAV